MVSMTPNEKAKQMVNCFYQPLGMVKQFQKLNSKQMWKYAQDVAKAYLTTRLLPIELTHKEMEQLEEILKEIDNV